LREKKAGAKDERLGWKLYLAITSVPNSKPVQLFK
jgi:hypothetical protein